MEYQSFLQSKTILDRPSGIEKPVKLNPKLFQYQREVVAWALRRGRALLGEAPGLGKSLQGMEWGRHVVEFTNKPVLIVAPLAVSQQFIREGAKFGYEVKYLVDQSKRGGAGLYVTNYERLEKFSPDGWGGVILDESSILKGLDGKIRALVKENWSLMPFRLSMTATPSPNSHDELGSQAEFLGVMSQAEMLATFFTHDGGSTQDWNLKPHARSAFWKWTASWGLIFSKPSDIGFSDKGFELPPLNIHKHVLQSDRVTEGFLFPMPAQTLGEQRGVKRASIDERVELAASIANKTKDQVLVWGELNDECDALEKAIPDSVQVSGSDSIEDKEARLIAFAEGKERVMVTKGKIAGFGLNLQGCHIEIFGSISHSWEMFFQMIKRTHRFGQKSAVDIHQILMDSETPILQNLLRKEKEAAEMTAGMILHMSDSMKAELGATGRTVESYEPKKTLALPNWIK